MLRQTEGYGHLSPSPEHNDNTEMALRAPKRPLAPDPTRARSRAGRKVDAPGFQSRAPFVCVEDEARFLQTVSEAKRTRERFRGSGNHQPNDRRFVPDESQRKPRFSHCVHRLAKSAAPAPFGWHHPRARMILISMNVWMSVALTAVLTTPAPPAEPAQEIHSVVSQSVWSETFVPSAVAKLVPTGASIVLATVGQHRDVATAARALAESIRRGTGSEVNLATGLVSAPDPERALALAAGGALVTVQTFDSDAAGSTKVVLSVHAVDDGALVESVNATAGKPMPVTADSDPAPAEAEETQRSQPKGPAQEAASEDAAPSDQLHLVARMSGSDQIATLFQVTMSFSGTSYGGPGGPSTVSGEGKRQVCRLPCDHWVDTTKGGEFFVGGDRLPRSKPFFLPDRGDVFLDVEPGSRPQAIGAIVGGGLVGGLLTPGIALLPIGVTTDDQALTISGGVMLSVGLALIPVVVVLLRRSRTKVTVRL